MIKHWRISAVNFASNTKGRAREEEARVIATFFACKKLEEHGVHTCPCNLNVVLTLHSKMTTRNAANVIIK